MSKIFMTVFALLAFSAPAFAQSVRVRGYTTRDFTQVQPYYRTAPDSSRFNNYSTRGNVNPYTGSVGTINPYRSSGVGLRIQPTRVFRW
jgi:hypothetical protein